MSSTATALLFLGVAAMIGLVVFLKRVDQRNRLREMALQSSVLGLKATTAPSRLADLKWLWRTTDRKREAWDVLEGDHAGWHVTAFIFRHDPDSLLFVMRVLTRLLDRTLIPVLSLATDSKTAEQRGILVAVEYEGPPSSFKVRGRKVNPRNEHARSLSAWHDTPIRRRVPPARMELRDGWFFLRSFYILPKWIGPYVEAATALCAALREAGAIQRRDNTNLRTGPLDF